MDSLAPSAQNSQVPTKRNNARFALLELLVILSFIALISAIGVPRFHATSSDQRRTTAINDLALSLNLARGEAIERARYVSVCKSSDGAICGGPVVEWEDGWIVFVNADAATPDTIDPDDEIFSVHAPLDDGLTLRRSGIVEGFLSFRPGGTLGTPEGDLTGTLTLCDGRGEASARAAILRASGEWIISHRIGHDSADLDCP